MKLAFHRLCFLVMVIGFFILECWLFIKGEREWPD